MRTSGRLSVDPDPWLELWWQNRTPRLLVDLKDSKRERCRNLFAGEKTVTVITLENHCFFIIDPLWCAHPSYPESLRELRVISGQIWLSAGAWFKSGVVWIKSPYFYALKICKWGIKLWGARSTITTFYPLSLCLFFLSLSCEWKRFFLPLNRRKILLFTMKGVCNFIPLNVGFSNSAVPTNNSVSNVTEWTV